VVGFIVLGVLIAIVVSWYPSKIPFSKSSRYDWYPDATLVMENMIVDRNKVHSIVDGQLLLIEELQRYTDMYHDETIQANINELIHNLGTGTRQASREVSEMYFASEKLSSTYRQAYTSIEAKAKKAGRLDQANNLLIALNQTAEADQKLQRSIQTLMIKQQKALPILKEQTQTMQTLVRQGNVLDIGRLAKEHFETVMDIDGDIYNVKIVVEQLIKIAENDDADGMKRAIAELKDQTVMDQYMSMFYGATGTVGNAVLGMVAFKSGYAIVSVTATAVAGPVAAAVGGVDLFGLAAYSFVTNFEKYNDASRYKTELDIVEVQRKNLHTAMQSLEKAVITQQDASNATKIALDNIVTRSASFSSIAGFYLPIEVRTALSNELLRIIQQYNTMMSFFKTFEPYTVKNGEKRLLE